MSTESLPVYATTHSLARIAGTSHGVIQRLVAQRAIEPIGFVEEGNRKFPLFDPAVAVVVVGMLNKPRTSPTDLRANA